MAVDTTPRTTVELGPDTAQALWAAMQDDDDLANSYVEFAILHSLTHLRNDGFGRLMTADRRARLLFNLELLRDRLDAKADEEAERWMSYTEQPI